MNVITWFLICILPIYDDGSIAFVSVWCYTFVCAKRTSRQPGNYRDPSGWKPLNFHGVLFNCNDVSLFTYFFAAVWFQIACSDLRPNFGSKDSFLCGSWIQLMRLILTLPPRTCRSRRPITTLQYLQRMPSTPLVSHDASRSSPKASTRGASTKSRLRLHGTTQRAGRTWS